MTEINQKEYLKRYLSGDKKNEKKRKRKKVPIGDRVKIIDDDIDVSNCTSLEEAADLFALNEDAPQVVGVIDERPMHLRIDDYRKSDLWKPVGAPIDDGSFSGKAEANEIKSNKGSKANLTALIKAKQKSVGDSPARSSRDSTFGSPNRKSSKDDDYSPPRRRKNSDSSPPRKRNSSRNSVASSPDMSKKDNDYSPPRRRKDATQKNSGSPPGRRKDTSQRDSDNSSRVNKRRDFDNSPQRPQSNKVHDYNPLLSSQTDDKPKRKLLPGDKKGKYLIPAKRTQNKATKTLDGKSAGLQSAQELVKENETFKKRENELFRSMPAEISGAGTAPIMRDRKTGKIRDLQKEAEEQIEKQRQEDENKEKYSRWGRGLKQVEDYEEKLAQDLHEMNKPLARYADDEDLEKFLKEQEREGDPMLDYIRKKRKKKAIESGKPLKPQYEGEFMPNRFGIIPGHRWDGVDRSNGYEKRWFEVQNAKRAQQEDVYKWSTEDM